MKLFGVIHNREHLDRQIAVIEAISLGVKGKSIMLELAPNYEINVQNGILHPNFFMALRDHFRSRCSQVICGDQELTIPENPNWLIAAIFGEDYYYPLNQRDETMISNAKTENPDIIVVGNGHSDCLKKSFPDAYYTVFQPKGGYRSSHNSHHNTWYKPNRIISI